MNDMERLGVCVDMLTQGMGPAGREMAHYFLSRILTWVELNGADPDYPTVSHWVGGFGEWIRARSDDGRLSKDWADFATATAADK